jgi:hypothetical protein
LGSGTKSFDRGIDRLNGLNRLEFDRSNGLNRLEQAGSDGPVSFRPSKSFDYYGIDRLNGLNRLEFRPFERIKSFTVRASRIWASQLLGKIGRSVSLVALHSTIINFDCSHSLPTPNNESLTIIMKFSAAALLTLAVTVSARGGGKGSGEGKGSGKGKGSGVSTEQ